MNSEEVSITSTVMRWFIYQALDSPQEMAVRQIGSLGW